MTEAEEKVWKLFVQDTYEKVKKDFDKNESAYQNNVTLALMMLESIVQENGMIWFNTLTFENNHGLLIGSIDGFVKQMVYLATRNLKAHFFE